MKITIVTVGKIGPSYLKEGIAEFLKRIQPYANIAVVEIKEEKTRDKPSAKDREKALQNEGESILKCIKAEQYVFLLDLHGKLLSSEALAQEFSDLAIHGKSDIVFIIGGPFGVDEALRRRANRIISFSPMTFTHQMIRLLLVEQIYRAFKINRNEPYHW